MNHVFVPGQRIVPKQACMGEIASVARRAHDEGKVIEYARKSKFGGGKFIMSIDGYEVDSAMTEEFYEPYVEPSPDDAMLASLMGGEQ